MFYSAVRGFCRWVLRLVFRWQIADAQRLPQEGAVIIVSNHANLIDPIIVGCCFERRVHFMAKQELFRIPVLRNVIKALGAYPVRRGTADRSAIDASFRILDAGGVVAMFPEGTRHRDGRIHPLRPGAALLAMRSKCRILPVIVEGSHRITLCRLPKINVYVGEAFDLPEKIAGDSEKEKTKNATSHIQRHMEELWKNIPKSEGKSSTRDISESGAITQ